MQASVRRLVQGGVAIVFAALAADSSRQKSATFDEPLHLLAGYAALTAGDHRVDPTHPPLGRMWAALPLLAFEQPSVGLEQIDAMRGRDWLQRNTTASQQFMFVDNDGERFLAAARLMIVALGALLVLLIGVWTRHWLGADAAIAAGIICTLAPNLLAHAGLVTTDIPVTLGMTAAGFSAWRLLNRPSWWWMLATGLATGAAIATKFSALLLAPVLLMTLVAGSLSGRSPLTWRRAVGAAVVIVVVSWCVIWAAYGFRYAPSESARWLFHAERLPAVQQHFGHWLAVATWLDDRQVLPNAFTHGLLLSQASVVQLPGYLAGSYSDNGWWYYFPIAFLIKTPVVMLGLFGVGLVTLWRHVRRDTLSWLDAWCVAVPALVTMAVAMWSGINIGVRHILPMYPAVIIVAAGAAAAAARAQTMMPRWVLAAATLFWCVQVGRAHPDHLAYFSSLVGGPANGIHYLADSNLDWGQDLKPLKAWMDAEGVEHINLAYFGTADPAYYGMQWTALPGSGLGTVGPPPQLPGYVAVSATIQTGVYLPRRWRLFYRSLRQQVPVATIGRSLSVYWLDRWPDPPAPAEWTPNRLAATRGLAESLAAWGWHDHSIRLYSTYLQQRPDDIGAIAGKAFGLLAAGRGAEALAHVETTKTRLPEHPALHDLHGRLLVAQNRLAEAVQAFEAAVRLDPAWSEPRDALRILKGGTLPSGAGREGLG